MTKPSIDKATPRPDAVTITNKIALVLSQSAHANLSYSTSALLAQRIMQDCVAELLEPLASSVRQDIADERVRAARQEVWEAAIVEVMRLPAFDDQNLLKQTFEYERDREARAAEGE